MPDLAISKNTLDEAIDRTHSAVHQDLADTAGAASALIEGVLMGARSLVTDALNGLGDQIKALDGWELNLHAVDLTTGQAAPIVATINVTIPALKLKLSGPRPAGS